MKPTNKPELGNYKSQIEIREMSRSDSEKDYMVVWRGVSATDQTVSSALRTLADEIEQLE